MISNKELKERLSILIKKYHSLTEREIKEMNEGNTRAKFIDDLLIQVLGWNKDLIEWEQPVETKGNIKHPDYWYPKIPKIIVEAKKLSLTREVESGEFNEQVQNYAYSKAVNWAILTNFKCFKAWYITRDKIYPFCDIDLVDGNPENIFDKLTWFQSENLLQGGIEEEAKRRGIKLREIDIAEDFSANLNILRASVNNYFKNNYKKYNDTEREELTQGLINRLIFIKKLEAENIEPNELEQIYRNTSVDTYNRIIKLFERYREKYDTDIFGRPKIISELEKIRIWDEVIRKLLDMISKPKSGAEYNFSAIDVDILGTIYENYLAYIQKGIELKGGKKERKEHGIYYTPKYIVDYIVKNTLGEAIRDSKLEHIENLKILDPACGSGSFLIGSINLLDKSYSKQIKDYDKFPANDRLNIIKNNIYGVDLDERAVQIAKLSIYLKLLTLSEKQTVTEGHDTLLPELRENIKNGNSIVDDKTIAGDMAFVWNEKFKDIMDNGGFDVIIGNPPWVFTRDVEFQDSFKEYAHDNYFNGLESISKSHARQSGKVNLYAIFLIKSIKLLKNHGIFGFIIPNNILRTTTYDIIRKFILDECKILKIVDLGTGVFAGVTASTIILILEKESNSDKRNKNNVIVYPDLNNLSKKREIEQKFFLENTSYTFNITSNKEERQILDKISQESILLGNITTIHAGGIATGSDKNEMILDYPKNSKYKPMLEGKDIKPFYAEFSDRYILYDREKLRRARDENIFLNPEKVITQRIGGGKRVIVAAYDNKQYYTFNSTNSILQKDKNYSLKYIVALLNSKLLNYYYVNKFTNESMLTVNISKTFLEQLPIKQLNGEQQKPFINLVDKILTLKEKLSTLKDKQTSQRTELEEEIDKIEGKLNELVYEAYKISESEKKLVKGYN